jgi:fatty-acyl-CoA synthase
LIAAAEAAWSGALTSPPSSSTSSGTTGRPKGAVRRRARSLWNALDRRPRDDGADHVLTVLPMFHVGGLIPDHAGDSRGCDVTLARRFD